MCNALIDSMLWFWLCVRCSFSEIIFHRSYLSRQRFMDAYNDILSLSDTNSIQAIRTFNVKWPHIMKDSQGRRFNKNISSNQYRKSHCGDETILRPSYLQNGITYNGKMASFYWIRALAFMMILGCRSCIRHFEMFGSGEALDHVALPIGIIHIITFSITKVSAYSITTCQRCHVLKRLA